MFSCEICEIFKNAFLYRTPLVAPSVCKRFWEQNLLFIVLALKKLRNYNQKLLYQPQKQAKTQPAFWTAIFQENLHFGTSDWLSSYWKINLLLVNSIYFVFLWKFKEASYRPSVPQVFLLCMKRNHSKTFKSIATAKQTFLKCLCYWYNMSR